MRDLQIPLKTERLRGTCPCANPNTDTTAERETSVTMVPRKKPAIAVGRCDPKRKLSGVMVMVMVVMVLVLPVCERRTCERHQ